MPVVHSVKVDWFKVLNGLNRAGYTMQKIADEIDVAKSTLLGWKQGSELRHSTGEALIELSSSVLSHDRSQLPFITCKSRFMLRSPATIPQLQVWPGLKRG